MKKATITRIWLAGLAALIVGLVVGGVSLGLMLANGGTWEPATTGSGSQFIPTMNSYFWTTLGFTITGFAIAFVGVIVHVVAWIGALLNTNHLADKTWFWVLLGSGVLTAVSGPLGFAAMIAYIVAGPDGTTQPYYEQPRYEQPRYEQPAPGDPMRAQPPREPMLTR